MEAGFLQHSEQFVIIELPRGCGGCFRKRRLMVTDVRGGNLVCSRDSRLAQRIRVSIGPRELNANGLEVLPVEGTINHVAAERGAVHRIPADFHVPVIADRPHIAGHRQRCLSTLSGIVVNPNFAVTKVANFINASFEHVLALATNRIFQRD